jgi:hypothetical protein
LRNRRPERDACHDGIGHNVVLQIPNYVDTTGATVDVHPAQLLYQLNRPPGNADVLGSQLLVHELTPSGGNPLAGLPASEPTGPGGSTTTSTTATIPARGSAGTTITVGSTNGFEISGRVYDTNTNTRMACVGSTSTTFTGCVLAQNSQFTGSTVNNGDTITADAVVPGTPGYPSPSSRRPRPL